MGTGFVHGGHDVIHIELRRFLTLQALFLAVFTVFHLFDLRQFPALIKKGPGRTIETEIGEPSTSGNGMVKR
jgi:hypothetical protein